MGNIIDTDFVNMGNLSENEIREYEDTPLSVIRTNGHIDDNWRISRIPHICIEWAGAHAIENRSCLPTDPSYGEWKVWMYHNVHSTFEIGNHICGWRRISTFWPTHLTTTEERNIWQQILKGRLDILRALSPVT